jgi:hypothetical protein
VAPRIQRPLLLLPQNLTPAFDWVHDTPGFVRFVNKISFSLNDEVEETRTEAHQLWEKVGLQYANENEKDLKDQMDFLLEPPKYYPKESESFELL